MRKLLLIAGIVFIAAGVLLLLFAALQLLMYLRTMDASPAYYAEMRRGALAFFAAGAVLTLLGVACILVRTRF